jgi:hypothetical protein
VVVEKNVRITVRFFDNRYKVRQRGISGGHKYDTKKVGDEFPHLAFTAILVPFGYAFRGPTREQYIL